MNRDIAFAWADRLQDPGLIPEKMMLRRQMEDGTDCFCALGVLCQMYAEATGTPWQRLGGGCNGTRFIHGEGYTLPAEVQAWSGVKTRVGIYHPHPPALSTNWRSIAQDAAQGRTMHDIADVIHRYWDIL